MTVKNCTVGMLLTCPITNLQYDMHVNIASFFRSYGTALTWRDDGYIKCKISRINERGLSANFNVSVIIEAPFGSTYAASSSLHVSAHSSLFMYQSYAGKCFVIIYLSVYKNITYGLY